MRLLKDADYRQYCIQEKTDYQAMSADAALPFKNGQMVVQDGVVINKLTGLAQTIAMKAWQPCL